ncbi:unnamed protein product, partial [Rotaria sp. Silwood2]
HISLYNAFIYTTSNHITYAFIYGNYGILPTLVLPIDKTKVKLLHIAQTAKLVEQNIVYLRTRSYSEVAIHFVKD